MGFPFKKFFAAVTTLAPIVVMLVPGGEQLAPYVPVLLAGIAEAEKLPGATGPEKKAHVLALVTAAADGLALAKPGKVDKTELLAASGAAIDSIIATVHVIEAAQVAVPDLPVMLLPSVKP